LSSKRRDPGNTALAQQAVRAAGLDQVEVVTGDAALTDQYRGVAPADLVLVCGVFGNVTDEDIERTIGFCSQLCVTGGTVIWTRHRSAPDRVPLICDWFEGHGFDRQWVSEADVGFGVGVHRFTAGQRPLALGERMFTFAEYVVLSERDAGA